MQMLAAFFWLLTIMTCVFAWCFGGRDGKWLVLISVSATLLTMPAQLAGSWHATQIWLTLVDLAAFVAFVWLMLRSDRYWPVWAAACQLMTVLTHITTLLIGNFSGRIYEGLSTVWVIPLLLFTIIGIELDRKASHDRAHPV
jgi:drug/metabolite transporter superfamily protein YnfA